MATQITVDGTPTNGMSPWVDSLVNGGAWTGSSGVSIVTQIKFMVSDGYNLLGPYFSGASWLSHEKAALLSALAKWENVANIDFVETTNHFQADIEYWLVNNETMEGFFPEGDSAGQTLGWHSMPGYNAGKALDGIFNNEGAGWSQAGLAPGGKGFVTLMHEIGHGLGLAHPHDGGKAPDKAPFPGVTSAGDLGDYGLNQGIWTTMSYNVGYQTGSPKPANNGYGLQMTPMALDIAAIQALYGPNMNYHAGNDFYRLPSANKAGTGWTCIWDAGGGADIISGENAGAAVTIDLRPAPLVGEHAGGYVSQIKGIAGGFTIAANAFIEKAYGGAYGDTLTGNGRGNYIDGGGGVDNLKGLGGRDTLVGGGGRDVLAGGESYDRFVFMTAGEIGKGAGSRDIITDFDRAYDVIDLKAIDANGTASGNGTFKFVAAQGSTFSGARGELRWYKYDQAGTANDKTILLGDANGDKAADFQLELTGLHDLRGGIDVIL